MPRCWVRDCAEPVIAGVSAPVGMSGRPAYILVRRVTRTETRGQLVCLHHAHHALDVVLARQADATAPAP